MKRVYRTMVVLLLCLSINYGHAGNDKENLKRIDQYLSKMAAIGFSGSVLIEINGVKEISRGYGYSDREKLIPNTPATIFDIGSITKQFTAAAILKLEKEGKLKVEDKISGYFNEVPTDKENISIHDLLRHRSGLISNVGDDYEATGEEEFLDKVWSSKLRFEVGSAFSYSNIGYSLLAMIIENVSGKSYETYLYENLWKPAKMEMTGYTRPDFDRSLVAVCYYHEGDVWGKPIDKEWDDTAPYWHLKGNGGVLSTTEDLYKWHEALMTEDILDNNSKDKLYHPALKAGETTTSYYAYGWGVSTTSRTTTQVWHDGTNNIYYASFIRYIDENTTLITLSNKSHPNFDHLAFELSRIIFNANYNAEIPVADNEENRNFTNHIIKTIEEFGLEKAKGVYKNRKKSEHLLEFLMRDEGFDHLDNQKPEVALQLFEMNVYAYPESAKALQGLGEGYMETGKNELALKYFGQSLNINPDNDFVLDMIKKLE